MLIHDNIYFHNVGELLTSPYHSGLCLQRVPQSVREQLETGARRIVRSPNGVELRFVPLNPDKPVEVILSCKYPTKVYLAYGDHLGGLNQSFDIDATPRPVPVVPHARFREFWEQVPRGGAFSPEVMRMIFDGASGPIYFHGVEDPVRPPRPDEMPAETLLAYGTSITAGAHATAHNLHGYPPRVARALGCDLLNYGCSGSALLEPALVDYMATQAFTRAVLCVSVNMVAHFETTVFEERARYLLETLHRARPEASIAAISILPYYGDHDPALRDRVQAYRQCLQKLVEEINSPRVSYLHGPDLLSGLHQLNSDLLHPSDHGFAEISAHLVRHFQTRSSS